MLSSLSSLILFATALGVPQPPAGCKEIKVTVVAILASECEGPVDPRLQAIAAEVRKIDPHLKRFQLASITNQTFAAGDKATFKLVENATVDVTIFCCGDKNDRVGIRVTPPLQGEIEYRVVCGKFLPLVTRYLTIKKPGPCTLTSVVGQLARPGLSACLLAAARLDAGCKSDRLILAMRVLPCPGK